MTKQSEMNWLSPLGISVILYLFYGFLYILIGVLTPIFWDNSPAQKPGLIISYRTDKILFEDEPGKINKENTSLHKFRRITLHMIAGLLVLSGLFIASIAWFGLRNEQMWSLVVLTIAGAAVLPFWYLVFKPYWEAGIKITLADAPPFIWVPAVLYLPAIILGWIGMR